MENSTHLWKALLFKVELPMQEHSMQHASEGLRKGDLVLRKGTT